MTRWVKLPYFWVADPKYSHKTQQSRNCFLPLSDLGSISDRCFIGLTFYNGKLCIFSLQLHIDNHLNTSIIALKVLKNALRICLIDVLLSANKIIRLIELTTRGGSRAANSLPLNCK